jgi:hypothetical protein
MYNVYILHILRSSKEGEIEFARKFKNSCEKLRNCGAEGRRGLKKDSLTEKRGEGELKSLSSGRRRVDGKIEEKLREVKRRVNREEKRGETTEDICKGVK